VLSDDELAEIRRRKMQLLMERASKPKVQEPLANGQVNPLFDSNFWQTIQQTKLAVVDFYGEWCMPCKSLAPILAELASEYAGKVFFAKVDIDRNRRTTTQFGVQSVPNVVVFKDGKPAGNIPGLRSYSEYDSVLARLAAPDDTSYV
jgi:thioredoxin 1